MRFAGRGLTAVNAVTAAVVLGHLLGAGPEHPVPLVAAVVLAGCGATAQAVLARDVGRRLRPFAAMPGRLEPPLARVIGMALLAVTAGLASTATWGWAQWVGSGGLAVVCGLFLATSALAAPFLLVTTEVHGPDPDTRLLGRAERILARRDRGCRRLDRRADRHVAAARRRLWRAERALAVVVDLIGPEHPQHLAAAVDRLRAEVAALAGRHATTEPPIDPDDLDLAG